MRVQVVLTLTPPRRPVKPAPPDFVPGQAGVARLVTKTCSGSVATNAPTMIKQGDAQQWGLLTLAQIMLAVIFSSVGISKANRGAANKGLAVAGLVLALVGLVLYFFIGLFSLGIGWVI